MYCVTDEQILEYADYNWQDIMTPNNVKNLKRLLDSSCYHSVKARYLVSGFTQGFDFGYRGPLQCTDISDNIPIKPGVGSPREDHERSKRKTLSRSFQKTTNKILCPVSTGLSTQGWK